MTQFEHFTEIDKSLREFLLDSSEINDLVDKRVFAYRASLPDGKEPVLPFITFKRSGGPYGAYRFLFRIRASSQESHALVRKALIGRLHSNMTLSTGENIVDVTLEGQANDGGDESTGFYESNFYVLIELLEAGYG